MCAFLSIELNNMFFFFFLFLLCPRSSVEQVLPDNLFASPTKAAGDHMSDFSTTVSELNECTALPSEKNLSSPISSACCMVSSPQ